MKGYIKDFLLFIFHSFALHNIYLTLSETGTFIPENSTDFLRVHQDIQFNLYIRRMNKHILITGGTGLVGSHLSQLLLQKGYTVSHLSRRKAPNAEIPAYQWDIAEGTLEEEALKKADYIVHLAGAGVADKSWTEARKQIILESRTKSTQLLAQKIQALQLHPRAFISASAIGIYGLNTGDRLLQEKSPCGDDFLAEVTKAWEQNTHLIEQQGIRTVKLRIGVVLSPQGGALQKLAQPVRLGVGAALGSGKQYISWIHLNDLCQMILYTIENDTLTGAYNAVAPEPVTNGQITQAIAKVLRRPLLMPNVPTFVLKLMLGEMANMVLGGCKVSGKKIEEAGFQFQFRKITEALQDLLGGN